MHDKNGQEGYCEFRHFRAENNFGHFHDAQKYDVSEKIEYHGMIRTIFQICWHKNISTKAQALKFTSAKFLHLQY